MLDGLFSQLEELLQVSRLILCRGQILHGHRIPGIIVRFTLFVETFVIDRLRSNRHKLDFSSTVFSCAVSSDVVPAACGDSSEL